MADEADIANSYIDRAMTEALNKLRQEPAAAQAGSKVCVECEEKIPDARRKLGFRLCIECAEESERRQSLFAE